VLVSSHVLDEIEKFGSRVLVVVQGRLAAEGDYRAIRDLMDDRPHKVAIKCEKARVVGTALLYNGSAAGVELKGDEELLVETDNISTFRHSISVITAHYGARLYEVRPMDDDLESVFRYLVST
jgi:ABC-2 type transport system ATP-binding protein